MPTHGVQLTCSACDWTPGTAYTVYIRGASGRDLSAILKSAWSTGLTHAWDNRGHIIHTHVDGRLRATQQVATMSEELGTVHNTVIVDEHVDTKETPNTTWGDVGETLG